MTPADLGRWHALQSALDAIAPMAERALAGAAVCRGDDRDYLAARATTLEGIRARLVASLALAAPPAPQHPQTAPQPRRSARA